MPTDLRRVLMTVHDESIFRVLGIGGKPGSVQVWNLLLRHARMIRRAARELELDRRQWNLIADMATSLGDNPEADRHVPAGLLLVAGLQEAQGRDRKADKWFGPGEGERAVADLVKYIARLSPIHHEAIMAAIRWFWTNYRDIDYTKDDWWTPDFRASAPAMAVGNLD